MPPRKSLSAFTTGADKTATPAEPAPLPKGVRPNPKAKAKALPKEVVKQQLAPESDKEEKVVSTTIRLPEGAWEQAKIMAFTSRIPVNRIYTMALDDYFEKHGKPRKATK